MAYIFHDKMHFSLVFYGDTFHVIAMHRTGGSISQIVADTSGN